MQVDECVEHTESERKFKLQENSEDIPEKNWKKMNRMACGTIILSNIGSKLSCDERDLCKENFIASRSWRRSI